MRNDIRETEVGEPSRNKLGYCDGRAVGVMVGKSSGEDVGKFVGEDCDGQDESVIIGT